MPLDTSNGIMAQAMAPGPAAPASPSPAASPAAPSAPATAPPAGNTVPPDFFSSIGGQINQALGGLQQAEAEPMPNAPPPMFQPAAPVAPPFNPIHAWGSTAMFLAGIGSLLTRTPLTSALNAASGVLTAYKQNDQEAAANATASWKAQTANALKLQQFELKQYTDAIKQHDGNIKDQAATLTALMTASKDDAGLAALQTGGIPAVLDLATKRKKAASSLADSSADLQHYAEEQSAWNDYQKAHPKPADPKKQAAWAAQTQAAGLAIFKKSISDHNENASDPDDVILPSGYSNNQYNEMAQATMGGAKPPLFATGGLGNAQKQGYEDALLKLQTGSTSTGPDKDPLAGYQNNRYSVWIPAYVLNGFNKSFVPPVSYSGNASDKAVFDQGVRDFMKAYKIDPMALSSRQATVKALNSSMSKLTAQNEQAAASEEAFGQQWQYVQDNYLAKGAPPTNLGPVLNDYLQSGKISSGDPNTVAYVTALGTLAEEYAKVISGSTGAQGSTVNAQEFARSLFQNGYSAPQITAAIHAAQANMSAKTASYPQQIQQMQTWIDSLPGTDGDTPGPVQPGGGAPPAPAAPPAANPIAPGSTLHYDANGNLVR